MTEKFESVEVDHKGLIEKMLTRYSTEFPVIRELMQNADDAEAKNFEIRFLTDRYSNPQNENAHPPRPDLTETVVEWIISHDGRPFNDDDWKRLKTIAKGNPHPEQVGTFGVGFYSTFSVTDEPCVYSTSGKCRFFFQDGTKELKLGMTSCGQDLAPWKVQIKLRTKQDNQQIEEGFFTKLNNFVDQAIPFTKYLKTVKVYHNHFPCFRVGKYFYPNEIRNLTPRANTSIKQLTGFSVSVVEVSASNIEIENFSPWRFPQGPLLSTKKLSFWSLNVNIDPPPNVQTALARATQKEKVDRNARLILTFGHLEETMPQGHIFVGHSTSQSTGFSGNISGPFLTTVERELLDLQPYSNVKLWNEQLLVIAGYLCRVAYDLSMESNHLPFISLLGLFTFQPSTPNSFVGKTIQDSIFSCTPHSVIVYTKGGQPFCLECVRDYNEFSDLFVKMTPLLSKEISTAVHAFLLGTAIKLESFGRNDFITNAERPVDVNEISACLGWVLSQPSCVQHEFLEAHFMDIITAFPWIHRAIWLSNGGEQFVVRLVIDVCRLLDSIADSEENRSKYLACLATLREKAWIPTQNGFYAPSEIYYSNIIADAFPRVPCLRPSSWDTNQFRTCILSTLEIKDRIDLKLVLQEDHDNPILVKFLIKHVCSEDEIRLLQNLKILHALNGTDRSLARFYPRDVYEESEIVKTLQLPTLHWSTEFPPVTPEEVEFLRSIGIRKHPELLRLLQFASMPQVHELCFEYFTQNFHAYRDQYNSEVKTNTNLKNCKFIPTTTKDAFGTPSEVFLSEPCSLLGFLVFPVENFAQYIPQYLGLRSDPPQKQLLRHLPQRLRTLGATEDAKKCLVYLGRIFTEAAINDSSLTAVLKELASEEFVPAIASENNKMVLVSLERCYFPDHKYQKLFPVVDFGHNGNSFLKLIGAKSKPTPAAVARYLITKPGDFLRFCRKDPSSYLDELKEIAKLNDFDLISDLKSSDKAFLLGCPPGRNISGPSKEFHPGLLKPDEVVILDDERSYALFFQDAKSLYHAPRDAIIEDFYRSLGCLALSKLITDEYTNHEEQQDPQIICDLRKHVISRLELLFRVDSGSDRDSSSFARKVQSMKKHHGIFCVKMYRGITLTKKLEFRETTTEKKSSVNAGYRVISETEGVHILELWVTPQVFLDNDWQEVAYCVLKYFYSTPSFQLCFYLQSLLGSRDTKRLMQNFGIKDVSSSGKEEDVSQIAATPANFSGPYRPEGRLPEASWLRKLWNWPRRKQLIILSQDDISTMIKEIIALQPGNIVPGNSINVISDGVIEYCGTRKYSTKLIAYPWPEFQDCPYTLLLKAEYVLSETDQAEIQVFVNTIVNPLRLRVFSGLKPDRLKIFYDPACDHIAAFNRDHIIYLSFQLFKTEHIAKLQLSEQMLAWFYTLTHELTHDRVDGHGAQFDQPVMLAAAEQLSRSRG